MNEIRYSKVFVVLCCLALHIATLSAQNDSVRFFNEVDTSFAKCMWGRMSGSAIIVRERFTTCPFPGGTTVRRSWCRARILRGRQGLLL